MFGFRSDRRAERSGGPGDNIRAGVLSLESVLEARVQQLCQPLLQGLEEGLNSRTWQLERSVATSVGPGRHILCSATHTNTQIAKATNVTPYLSVMLQSGMNRP